MISLKRLRRGKEMREFSTGATRNNMSDNKLGYEGFFAPRVLRGYAEYMHAHRKQADGKLRDPDNWQKGIPKEVYMDSMVRHVFDLWAMWRDEPRFEPETGEPLDMETVGYAIMFNIMGLLFELTRPEKKLVEAPEDKGGVSIEPCEKKREGVWVYVAGPMRHHKFYNYPAFKEAAEELRRRGFKVVNPIDKEMEKGFDPFDPSHDWDKWPNEGDKERIIAQDLNAIMGMDMVLALPGWEDSDGACAEVALAKWRGIPVVYAEQGYPCLAEDKEISREENSSLG